MPADERATLREIAQRLSRHDSCCASLDTYRADVLHGRWPDCDCDEAERCNEIEQALKEADQLAREDAARIVESSLFGCVWGSDLLPLQKRYAAAIRASITTDEG